MEMVTKRDMEDARALGERAGIDGMDDWDQFVHDIAQSIADGRRTDPLPWDAGSNRDYAPVEARAAEIYAAMPFEGPSAVGEKPAWAPHGNSIKQDEARVEARRQLRAAGHDPT